MTFPAVPTQHGPSFSQACTDSARSCSRYLVNALYQVNLFRTQTFVVMGGRAFLGASSACQEFCGGIIYSLFPGKCIILS